MNVNQILFALIAAAFIQSAHAETVSYQGIVNQKPIQLKFNLSLPANLNIVKPSCVETNDCGPSEFDTEQYLAGSVSVDCGAGDVRTMGLYLSRTVIVQSQKEPQPFTANLEMNCELTGSRILSMNNSWQFPLSLNQSGQVTTVGLPTNLSVNFGVYASQGGLAVLPSFSSGTAILTRQ